MKKQTSRLCKWHSLFTIVSTFSAGYFSIGRSVWWFLKKAYFSNKKILFGALFPIPSSRVLVVFLGIFAVLAYIQDIYQDVLVIVSSLSSSKVYNVMFNLKMAERSFWLCHDFLFGQSIIVIGWDTIGKVSQLGLVKRYPRLHVLIGLACILNLGPIFSFFWKWFYAWMWLRSCTQSLLIWTLMSETS